MKPLKHIMDLGKNVLSENRKYANLLTSILPIRFKIMTFLAINLHVIKHHNQINVHLQIINHKINISHHIQNKLTVSGHKNVSICGQSFHTQ